MAEFPEDSNVNQESLDNLRESINLSRQLIDNAKALYNVNKEGASEMYKGFRDAAKLLSKSLQDTNLHYEKYLGYGADYKKILEKIVSIEKFRDNLITERMVLDKLIQQRLKEQLSLTKQEEAAYERMTKSSSVTRDLRKAEWEIINKKGLALSKEITVMAQSILASKQLEKSSLKQLDTLKEYSEVLGKVQGKVSLMKRVYESMAKIPLIGGFVDAEKGVTNFQKAQILKKGFWTSLGSSINGAFSPLAKISIWVLAIEGIVNTVKFFIGAMFGADKMITDISRKMSITKDEASKIRNQFIGITQHISTIATVQEGILFLTKDVYETWLDINNQLGIAIQLDGQFLGQMTLLKTKIGLSSEALKGLTYQSKIGEVSAEGIVKSIISQNILLRMQGKSGIENFKLIESTLKVNGQLRALYKANTDEIARGVAQAHAMGTTLEQLNNIAKGFLDFESSISAEFESQLLTGKNINLDAARYFSLTGQTNEMMKEIQKNFPSWEEFNRMNRIAQEGYAKALGMSVDQMSNMVFEQQTLAKVTKQNTINILGQNNAAAAAELMKAKSSKDILNTLNKYNISIEQRTKLLGEEQYLQLQNQSAQDKFAIHIEKLKETFATLVDGGYLDKFANLLIAIVNSFSKGITGVFSVGREFEKAQMDTIKKRSETDLDLAKKIQKIEEDRSGIAGIRQRVQTRKILELNKPQDDFVVKGNTVTPFRKDDIIMGGTNLGGGNEELQKLNKNIEILIGIVKEGKDINLDSYKVGTILSIGSVKTQ